MGARILNKWIQMCDSACFLIAIIYSTWLLFCASLGIIFFSSDSACVLLNIIYTTVFSTFLLFIFFLGKRYISFSFKLAILPCFLIIVFFIVISLVNQTDGAGQTAAKEKNKSEKIEVKVLAKVG